VLPCTSDPKPDDYDAHATGLVSQWMAENFRDWQQIRGWAAGIANDPTATETTGRPA
jgi:hypothetical protein